MRHGPIRDRGRRGRRTSSRGRSTVPTRGVVYVHSTPLAVCPHVEWAIARVLSAPVRLEWTAQPVEPNARRAECTWSGRSGTGGGVGAAPPQGAVIPVEGTQEPPAGGHRGGHIHVAGRGPLHPPPRATG